MLSFRCCTQRLSRYVRTSTCSTLCTVWGVILFKYINFPEGVCKFQKTPYISLYKYNIKPGEYKLMCMDLLAVYTNFNVYGCCFRYYTR